MPTDPLFLAVTPILLALLWAGLRMTGTKVLGLTFILLSLGGLWVLFQPTTPIRLWGGEVTILILCILYGWYIYEPAKQVEPTPPLHTDLPFPPLQKEASTPTRPQERTVDDTLQEVLGGTYSRRTVGDELAHLQSQRNYLWIKLKEAAPKDKPALIRKLEHTIRQQLRIEADLCLLGKDKEQLNKIVKELEDLRDVEKTLRS